MLKETGIVTDVQPGRILVSTKLQTSCTACSQKAQCGTSSVAKAFADKQHESVVYTDEVVKPGQRVLIGVSENGLLGAAFLVYIMPLIGFFLASVAVENAVNSGILAFNDSPVLTFMAGIVGGYLGFTFARHRLKKTQCDEKHKLILLGILDDDLTVQVAD